MYEMIVTVIAVIGMMAAVLLFVKAGFLQKVLVKFGFQKKKVAINWTAFSWESSLRKMGCKADVVFLGDSITRGGDFHIQFPQLTVANLGSSGDTLAGMIGRVTAIQAFCPKKVFLQGGINGLTDFNLSCCISQYEDLICKVEQEVPDAKVYIQSTLPLSAAKSKKICKNSTIAAFNDAIRQLAEKHGHTYIDLYSLYLENGEMNPADTLDGLHLKPEGYNRWYKAIRKYMQ